jgi:FkbM family methyltransferase
MHPRLKRLTDWFSGKKYGTPFISLLKTIFSLPTFKKGQLMIKSIKESGGFYSIELKGIKHKLYYPKNMPLDTLRYTIKELFFDYDDHYYEIKETKVSPGDVVVDCGAAEGLFPLMIMNRCKKVYAIEPLPDYIRSLKKTFADVPNVEVIQSAIGDKKGKGILKADDVASTLINSGDGISVEINTIDDLFFNKGIKVSYIKSDTEGFDLAVMKGAERTIKMFKPKIAVAVYHKADECEQIHDFIISLNLGYKIKIKGINYVTNANMLLHAWID